MYSNFKNIQITKRKIFIVNWNDETFEFNLTRDLDAFHENKNPTVDGKHMVVVTDEWIIIEDTKKLDAPFKIFNPQQFKWQVNKDIKTEGGLFDLNYRKHLRFEYSTKWIKIGLMGWTADDSDYWRKPLRHLYKMAREFCTGRSDRPLLIVNVMDEQLEYMILKNDIMIRRGSINVDMEWS